MPWRRCLAEASLRKRQVWCRSERVAELHDGVVIPAHRHQVHTIKSLEHGVVRIQFQGPLDLCHCFFGAPHDHQEMRVDCARVRIVRVDLESPPELRLRSLPVRPRSDDRQALMNFGKRAIQFQGFRRGRLR